MAPYPRACPSLWHAPLAGCRGALLVVLGVLTAACPPAGGTCRTDRDCGGGAWCIDGVCRQACNTNLDCTGREQCRDGVCLPATAGDAAPVDTALRDATPVDTAVGDALRPDATLVDASFVDAAAPDATPIDASFVDAAAPDATPIDASFVDAAAPDATPIDASFRDVAAPDGTPVDAAGVDAGGGGAIACGRVALMADDFEDGVADWRWMPRGRGGAGVTETLGHLAISLAANVAGDVYAGYDAGQHTSLLGGILQVELVQGVSTVGSPQASLVFRRDLANQMTITQTGGKLHANLTVAGTTTSSGAVAYSADLHRWLRIRERDRRVFFETSADGASWSNLYAGDTPAFASAGRVMLEAGTYKAESAPGRAIFDNLGPPQVGEDWCLLSTLQDDFGGSALGPVWDPGARAGCTIAVEAQTLAFEASDDVLCSLLSAAVYWLDQGGVSVEITRVPTEDAEAQVRLALLSPVDGTDLELAAHADGRIMVWDSLGLNYETFNVPDPRRLWIHRDAAGIRWKVVDAEANVHLVYSQLSDQQLQPFYAILQLDCQGCRSGTMPVHAALDNVNVLP